jgi:arabinogalactan oligomer / maltooligosaccharide transport system substrate-binding protein
MRLGRRALSQCSVPISNEFREAYGIDIQFLTGRADDLQPRFIEKSLAREDAVPDVFAGAHDWVGKLARAGVISPLVLAEEHQAVYSPWALDAFTYDGRLYGLPGTVDTVALLRNLDLASDPPASLDDLIASGQALVAEGRTREVLALRVGASGDAFQVWPLISSGGGWLFGRKPDGNWDPTNLGLGAPETISAFRRLRELGESGLNIIRRDIDAAAAYRLFCEGDCAYFITSSDGLVKSRAEECRLACPPYRHSGTVLPQHPS